MATRRLGKPSRAARILRAGLARGLALARKSDGQILSVGTGHKYSRESGGYGLRRVPCIKFFVRRKRTRRDPGRDVPAHLRFRVDGRPYTLPTDVEALQTLRQHAPPLCREAGTPGPFGTPTAFFHDVSKSDRPLYMLTAGHVLKKAANGARVRLTTSSSDSADVGSDFGTVVAGGTYFERPAGSLVDIGLVRVDHKDAIPSGLMVHPWRSAWDLATADDLREAILDERPMDLWMAGMSGTKSLEFDALSHSLDEDPQVVPVVGLGSVVYAPVLLHTRAARRKPIKGDSGSPVLDENDDLVGLHVLGGADSVDDTGPNAEIEIALVLSEALDRLRRKTGIDLELTSL